VLFRSFSNLCHFPMIPVRDFENRGHRERYRTEVENAADTPLKFERRC